MQAVRHYFETFFALSADQSIDPLAGVAFGAAIQKGLEELGAPPLRVAG